MASGLVYLDFNGTGYVDCGTGYPIAGTSNFSFGCWFSPWSISAGETELMFSSSHFRIAIDSAGKLVFGLANHAGSFYWVTTDEAVQVGGRYFVMCTYDGATMCIYVNGVLAKSGVEVSGDILASAIDNVTLGGTRFGVFLYDGAMAEAMLWLRTLSPQEVKELYFFPLNSIA